MWLFTKRLLCCGLNATPVSAYPKSYCPAPPLSHGRRKQPNHSIFCGCTSGCASALPGGGSTIGGGVTAGGSVGMGGCVPPPSCFSSCAAKSIVTCDCLI